MSDVIKYQVFVSSTYTDFSEERRKILDALLKADCIPAGMENFVAQDDEQFSVIKKVIDLCDYYILILGKRYGSINEKTGISYTEMEYDYAIEKGIPILVFALDESNNDVKYRSNENDIKKGKLAEFRKRALSNRLARVWKDSSDLVVNVAIAIMQAKSEIKRPGWHKGTKTEDKEKLNLMFKNVALKREVESLKQKVDNLQNIKPKKVDQKFFKKRITLHYTESIFVATVDTIPQKKIMEVTLSNLFGFISLRLTGKHTVNDFINAVSSYVDGFYVAEQDALVAKNQYEQLNLIKSSINKNNQEFIELTELGRKMMNELNA